MNTQFRKGVLEICVLTLISKKDMYGYEIVQNSEWNEFVYAVNTFLND